jgi:hypothetical protein
VQPYYQDASVTIYHGDWREVLPTVAPCDAVVTDPPYLTADAKVPIRGKGVAARRQETKSVGNPWGYSLDWIEAVPGDPAHWIVFAHFAMLGGLCTRLPPSALFVWRKSNAPNMTRPVPRMDCEFIVWRGKTTDRMREFRSLVLDVPMPQAGCMASERLVDRTGKARHPCQKPLAIVKPFIARLNARTILDPFIGTGTTLVAAKDLGRMAIGCDDNEECCEMAAKRLRQEVLALAL